DCIENTLKLRRLLPSKENIKKEIVDQNSLTYCMDKIEALLEKVDGEVEYIVNITGGNKIMALAAYEIFREIGQKVIIGYMPLGKNEFIQIFPRKKPLKSYDIKERLTIEEYLMSYGFGIQNKEKCQAIKERAIFRKDNSGWILDNYENLKGVLGFLYKQIGKQRNQKNFHLSATFDREFGQIEREMLDRHHFEIKDSAITKDMTKDEIGYLTGGWLEEYVFNEVYKLVQDSVLDDITMGINIESFGGTSNELDIAFIKDNFFYHIECKTLGDEEEQKIIRDEVYKRGAILKQLGLGEKRAIICTTHNQISEAHSARAKEYGVEILQIHQVRDLKNQLLKSFGIVTHVGHS
ncbi:MAG: DUF1887 family CARF protein, partial [Nitrospinota bacterium]